MVVNPVEDPDFQRDLRRLNWVNKSMSSIIVKPISSFFGILLSRTEVVSAVNRFQDTGNQGEVVNYNSGGSIGPIIDICPKSYNSKDTLSLLCGHDTLLFTIIQSIDL